MALLQRYRVALLVMLLVGTCSAATYGFHSQFFFFFFRRPAAAVPEGTTFVVDAERGLLYQVMFDGTNPATRTRIDLDLGLTAATVNDQNQLVFEQIVLTGTDGTTTKTVTIDLDPADLRGGFFGSYFLTRGTATCDDGTTSTTIDVFVSGTVSQRGEVYHLRSTLRGFESSTDTAVAPPLTTLTLLRVSLNGTGVAPEELPTTTLP